MRFGQWLLSYWPETLLFMAVALSWLSLFALGLVWLWEGGHVWVWAIAAAALGLLAWPLSITVNRRANEEARLVLGDLAEPSRVWNTAEQEAGPRYSKSRMPPRRSPSLRWNRSSPAHVISSRSLPATSIPMRAVHGRASVCRNSCC